MSLAECVCVCVRARECRLWACSQPLPRAPFLSNSQSPAVHASYNCGFTFFPDHGVPPASERFTAGSLYHTPHPFQSCVHITVAFSQSWFCAHTQIVEFLQRALSASPRYPSIITVYHIIIKNSVFTIMSTVCLYSQIVEFLKRPERFTAVGARIPKGCLLVGPPGEWRRVCVCECDCEWCVTVCVRVKERERDRENASQ